MIDHGSPGPCLAARVVYGEGFLVLRFKARDVLAPAVGHEIGTPRALHGEARYQAQVHCAFGLEHDPG